MGKVFSKDEPGTTIQDLQSRIDQIERLADLNGDGIVTTAELQRYSAEESLKKDAIIAKLTTKNELLKENIKKYVETDASESRRWKDAYDQLHKKYDLLLQSIENPGSEIVVSQDMLSITAIDTFVDQLLADPNINIYMLPDSIEKPIYTNMIKLVLSVLQKSLNNVSMDVIGHEIKVNLSPKN